MSEKVEPNTAPGGVPDIQAEHKTDHVYDASEKDTYNRAGAIEAEQMEFQMGVIDTVKAYPAASWWAFVMSCTIVSLLPRLKNGSNVDYLRRSWRPIASF